VFEYLNSTSSEQNYWFECLEKTYHLYIKFLKPNMHPKIKHLIEDLIDTFIVELTKAYPEKQLLTQIEGNGKYADLDRNLIQKLLVRLLMFHSYDFYILNAHRQLVTKDFCLKVIECTVKSDRGLYLKPECCACQREINENEKALAFGCQHVFHYDFKCLKENKDSLVCPICSKSEAYIILSMITNRFNKNPAIKSDKSIKRNESGANRKDSRKESTDGHDLLKKKKE